MVIIQHCYAFHFLDTYQPLLYRRFKGTVRLPRSRSRRPRSTAAPVQSDSRSAEWEEGAVELSLSLAMRSSSRCIRWDYILQHFSFERTSSRFVSNDNVDTQRDAFDESALVNASNKSKCVLLREVQTRTRVLRQFSPILWLTFVRHKALMLKIEITWTTGLRVSWIRKAPKYRDREIISIFCIFCTCLLKRLLG